MNNIKVYSNNEGVICGLFFEYDNTVRSKIIMKNIGNYDTVINMDLKVIKSDCRKMTFVEYGDDYNDQMIDYITHIIGNFSNKLEFLGFKTANGKFYFYGDPKIGQPFLIGKFFEKFHYMKIGFSNEGICFIEPYFKTTLFNSTVPRNCAYHAESKLIDDEVIINQFRNPKEVLYALYYHDLENDIFALTSENDTRGMNFNTIFYPECEDFGYSIFENPFSDIIELNHEESKALKDEESNAVKIEESFVVSIENFSEIEINQYLNVPEKLQCLCEFLETQILINSKKQSIDMILPDKNLIKPKFKKLEFNKSFYQFKWAKFCISMKRKIILSSIKKIHLEKILKEIQVKFSRGFNLSLEEQILVFKILRRIKNDLLILKITRKLYNTLIFSKSDSKYVFPKRQSIISNKRESFNIGSLSRLGTKTIVSQINQEFSDVMGKLDKSIVNELNIRNSQNVFSKKKEEFTTTIKKLKINDKSKILRSFSFNDYKMPAGIKILFSQIIPKDNIFTDSYFPPEFNSLVPVDENGKIILPKDVEMNEISEWEEYEWKRAQEIFNSNNFQVFENKIEPDDILQGNIGNCYFLAAVASLAGFGEDLVSSRFLFRNQSKESCYGIYLRISGIWKLVILDDYFPVVKSYRKYELSFAKSNGKELWVILFEKAWAKLCGSYVNTIGGLSNEVFSCITNSYTEIINVPKIKEDLLWEKLLNGEKNKFLMSSGSGQNFDQGIVSGHAYSILRIKEIKNLNLKLIELRNPYGEVEWTGDWSDSSDKWTTSLKIELNVINKDDGIFWMSFSDFMTYFQIVNICKIHKDFHNYEIKYSKLETKMSAVCELTVTEDSLVYIQIHQRNKRFRLKDGTYPQQVLLNLVLVDDKFDFIESITSKKNIECIEKKLSQGKYYIISDINYRFEDNSKVHGYALTCYSEKNCYLNKHPDISSELQLKKAIISYAKKNIHPVTSQTLGNEILFYKKISTPFPGQIFLFENKSNSELEANLKFTQRKNCGVYNFETHTISNEDSYCIAIKPCSNEVVFMRYINNDYEVSHIEERVNGQYFPIILK